jgi:hypothetical protein
LPLAKQEVEDWSVASALPSVCHEASPNFLVKWGQDPHGLLLQTIIGRSQNFGGPSGPSGQNSIFRMRAGGRDDGISTLRSHQYSLVDEGVTEEIKRQTFSKRCFAAEGFLINMSVTVRLVCLLAPGAVMSLSTSITSLSRSRSDILRLSAALAACCSVCCFCFVAIVNFLSHREESGLQRTIIFRVLHAANSCLTLMLTTACYLRGHVTLDCKSPVPVCFAAEEETLGMLFVPTARAFPGKVCRRNCTEE